MRDWVPAAKTSAALCALFMLVYGGCNWLTGLRADVGTWYSPWERRIPFVPLMLWPYLSIALFFVAAPFLCPPAQRRVLVRRLVMALATAAIFFLSMPLRFAFDPPPA